jgi:hypothetical protein
MATMNDALLEDMPQDVAPRHRPAGKVASHLRTTNTRYPGALYNLLELAVHIDKVH